MPALTATLIAFNEERDLPRTLASLEGVADEIILVDSGSTDRTSRLPAPAASALTRANWTAWPNRKITPLPFRPTTGYCASIATRNSIPCCGHPSSPGNKQSRTKPGYSISLLTNYLGGWISHSGWYPDYKVKLYRRDLGRFVERFA